MNILEFSKIFQGIPVFSTKDIEKRFPGFERENLLNWQKKGYLLRVRNGWYSLADGIKTLEQVYYTANKIYAPSYISLESAFAHYGWIPEGVFTLTSISTRKTTLFDTPKGRFSYASIKPALFFGYRIINKEGHGIKMAEPEKALLDFLYFHPKAQEEDDFESYRFNFPQMRADIQSEQLVAYSYLFSSPSLMKRLSTINKLINNAQPY